LIGSVLEEVDGGPVLFIGNVPVLSNPADNGAVGRCTDRENRNTVINDIGLNPGIGFVIGGDGDKSECVGPFIDKPCIHIGCKCRGSCIGYKGICAAGVGFHIDISRIVDSVNIGGKTTEFVGSGDYNFLRGIGNFDIR